MDFGVLKDAAAVLQNNWWVAFRDPRDIWEKHPSFLICELTYYVLALLTFLHASRHGGRFLWLWFTTILHGLTTESLSYFLPDIDNFWHAQSMVMLLGKRLPVHIIFFYPVFLYTAAVAVSRLRLPKWAEPFAMGLSVVLLDVPFDIMGIKLLWWSWHDTDPNIYDRHYWVPWTSYYFHATFASSFCFLFHGTRRLLCNKRGYVADSFLRELPCSLLTGLLSMPLGALQFIPVYHGFHDNLGVHTEVCVLLLVALYGLVWWSADRNPSPDARPADNRGWFDEISLHVLLHFLLYIVLVLIEKPENNRSVGLHEPVGNCSLTSPVQTVTGKVLTKKTYLCSSKYDEGYFDFHCLPGGKAPADGLDWYTICGTPFPNHAEYIIVVSAFSLLGLIFYITMLACSGRQIRPWLAEQQAPRQQPKQQPRQQQAKAAPKTAPKTAPKPTPKHTTGKGSKKKTN